MPRLEHVSPYPGWLAALDTIQAALTRPGLVALVGPPGTGKTLMLRQVAVRLVASGLVPAVLNHATARHRRVPGHPDVILIDDADRLPAPILLALARHGRPVVVVSGHALVATLENEGLHPTVVALPLLSQDEARQFLVLQLLNARQPVSLIQPAALLALFERSAGQPRSLQLLAGLSVFVARMADSAQVTPAHVAQAALIQHGTEDEDDEDSAVPPRSWPSDVAPALIPAPTRALPRPRTGRTMGIALAALLGLGILAVVPMSLQHDRPQSTAQLPVPTGPAVAPEAPTSLPTISIPSSPTPVPPSPAATTPVAPGDASPEIAPASLRARPILPLPPVTPVHVVIAYPEISGAAAQANRIAESLRRAGYQVAPPRMTATREQPGVSYVFAEDAAMADLLARATGLRAKQVRPAAPTRPGSIRVVPGPSLQQHDLDLLPSRSALP